MIISNFTIHKCHCNVIMKVGKRHFVIQWGIWSGDHMDASDNDDHARDLFNLFEF